MFEEKLEKKFVVARIHDNDIKVLKRFDLNDKDAAMAYGEKIARTNPVGTISCFTALVAKNGRVVQNEIRIYKSWGSGRG